MSELILSEKEKLQGVDNFPIWYSIMMDYLRAKKITKYITYNVNGMLKKLTSNGNLIPEDSDFNENLEAEDAMACTIILTNVCDKIKTYIKDCKTAHERMKKIEKLYKNDNSAFYGMWMKKLYSIRAKDVQETMNVTNEIMELFRLLNDSPTKPTNIEKIIIMHDALPNDLKSKVIVSSKLTPEQFYEEIKDKFTVFTYKNDRVNNSNLEKQKTKSIHSSGDIPDLNNIENKKRNMIQRKFKNKMRKYCLICNKNGHLAKDCYFNPCGTNRNNKRCIFNKNFKKKLNNTNSNKNKEKQSINNIEIDEENYKDKTLCYDEIQTMFGPSINNLEHDEAPTQNEDNYTTWTYDTGASEHITNNKNILEDYTENKTTMKCANNTLCHFEGYGTYHGIINNHKFTLNKVYYSTNSNKNIISRIKLAKSGINVSINNINEKISLTLTNNNNKIIDIIFPDQFNIVRIKATNLKPISSIEQ